MLCFGYIIRTKCPFFVLPEIVHTTNVLHNIYVPAPLQAQFATALNSTLAMLMIEYGGRSNLSGILKLELYELAALPVPNPYGLSAAPRAALLASDHALLARGPPHRDRLSHDANRRAPRDRRAGIRVAGLDGGRAGCGVWGGVRRGGGAAGGGGEGVCI